MKNVTTRQRSLFLAAKLYELAAEFTDAELQQMLRESPSDGSGLAVQSAIKVLMDLHRLAETQSGQSATYSSARVPPGAQEVSIGNAPSRQASSLTALFSDKTAFPTVADIADVMRSPVRPKESRERYVARMVKHVESLSSRDRADFFESIAMRLNKAPESFISKWSKVIGDL